MIELKKLAWENCFSYGSGNELELNGNTLTQIIGVNGVGKSSIPLIIEEVLFNKNSKGVKKVDLPNRYRDGSYKIALEFSKDSENYFIEVLRKGANIKVRLLRNGEDISSHTATNTFKTIQEDIIGIDFKTFSQLVYQSTNASLQFLTATDTARKKFLIDLLGLEEYIVYYDKFKDLLKESMSEMTNIEGAISTINNWLTTNKLTERLTLPILALPEVSPKAEEELKELQIALSNIASTNKKISNNLQYKSMLSKIDIIEINKIEATEHLSYDSLQKQLGQETATQNSARKILDKLGNLHGVCPTCTQEIDENKINELIVENAKIIGICEDQIQRLGGQIQSAIKNNSDFAHKQKQQKEFEELFRLVDKNLPSTLIDEQGLKLKIKVVTDEIAAVKAKIRETAELNQKAEKHNTRIQVIDEQTEQFEHQLQDNLAKLSGVQEKVANLEILKKAFSTNGLLAYKIENLVKELEELTNNYLAELSDGRFTIEFIVTNDKLNVQITDNGNIVDILSLSSGELARVNTATLLAIRKLMSSISKTKINILFLDEVISVLDEAGREKLVEILLKEEELNTYLVSHSWTHPLVSKIEIVKRNNMSFLE